MTTLIQTKYAQKLVSALNAKGFKAELDGGDQEYAPVVRYSKDGIHPEALFVKDLVVTYYADSAVIKEQEDSIKNDIEHCQFEVDRLIEMGHTSSEGKTDDELLAELY